MLRFVGVLYKEQRLHLVTEYIGGGTLRALLEGPRAPPWAERAGYARDIAAGLAYLHRMNIIHRDLNSHNCLVREVNCFFFFNKLLQTQYIFCKLIFPLTG